MPRLSLSARRLRRLAVVPVLGLVGVAGLVAPSSASSHREAPLSAQDPEADNTDVFAFVAPDAPDAVTLVADYIPFQEPSGGPNYFQFGDDVLYRINLDNNGDGKPDIQYEFRFTTTIVDPSTFLYATGPITKISDKTYNIRQSYSVAEVKGNRRVVLASNVPVPPDNIGPRSTPNYGDLAAQANTTITAGADKIKVFAGQREDPFWVDTGSIFDLAGLRPFNQNHAIKLPNEPGRDGLGGFNVHSLVLQIPKTRLTADGSPGTDAANTNSIVGVWADALRKQTRVLSTTGARPQSNGRYVVVSRLGNPLVNEVVIPLADKDRFNNSVPADDAQFAKYVLDPGLAKGITALYGIPTPAAPRNDLVAVFLTGIKGLNQPANVTAAEEMRLNMAIPPKAFGMENPLGVIAGDNAGFPNGRRLRDDVTDIELRAVAGGTVLTPAFNKSPNNILGDGVNGDDAPQLTSFPYVGLAFQGYADTHGAVGSAAPLDASGH